MTRERTKKPRNSCVGEEIADDIVREILSRLPVKSLCRFKCVSKLWDNLISDPEFVKLQLRQSLNSRRWKYVLFHDLSYPGSLKPMFNFRNTVELDYKSLLSGQQEEAAEQEHSLKLEDYVGRITELEVWGSCDGLVCIHTSTRILMLANLSTRDTKKIFSYYSPNPGLEISLSDDQTAWGGGFGVDRFTGDYKVVRINPRGGDVFVYSRKNDSWNYYGKFPYFLNAGNRRGKHLNGVIHWLVGNVITGFDLKKEEFFDIPTPDLDGYNAEDYR